MASKGGAPRWSQAELDAHLAKRGQPHDPIPRLTDRLPKTLLGPDRDTIGGPGKAFQALGRLPKGQYNKTEAAYAETLAAKKHDGTILDWKFHAIRVRLADNTYYEPDFLVLGADGRIEIHETKGSYTTQAGRTKVKMCAEVLPWFRVIKASKTKTGWEYEEFNK